MYQVGGKIVGEADLVSSALWFIHSVGLHQIVVLYGTVHCKYLYAPLFVYGEIIKH